MVPQSLLIAVNLCLSLYSGVTTKLLSLQTITLNLLLILVFHVKQPDTNPFIRNWAWVIHKPNQLEENPNELGELTQPNLT